MTVAKLLAPDCRSKSSRMPNSGSRVYGFRTFDRARCLLSLEEQPQGFRISEDLQSMDGRCHARDPCRRRSSSLALGNNLVAIRHRPKPLGATVLIVFNVVFLARSVYPASVHTRSIYDSFAANRPRVLSELLVFIRSKLEVSSSIQTLCLVLYRSALGRHVGRLQKGKKASRPFIDPAAFFGL